MSAPHYQNPELLRLFEAYTASDASIGAAFAEVAHDATTADPLIVATGSDVALYPGNGAPPIVLGFRLSTRGFREVAALSHLGPAMATLARLKTLDPGGAWRDCAVELLASARAVREVNGIALWRDQIAVPAFEGRSAALAAMTDYSCAVTERVLEQSLSHVGYLTADTLRRDYLDGPADTLPVPFNRIMVATFFLTGLDLAYRLIGWFDDHDVAWERAMVVIAGKQGRPTAGVTRSSNSIAGVIATASRGRLPDRNLLIAPHAPVFPLHDGGDVGPVQALESTYRAMWSRIVGTTELGEVMFAGFPRFEPQTHTDRALLPGTASVPEMPAVAGPDDWFALTTRLRVVLEDPRQLLSGAVTDVASRQLVENGNDPRRVVVPGLDGEPYPGLLTAPGVGVGRQP